MAAVCALLAAGCGADADGSPGDVAEAFRAAVRATASAESFTVRIRSSAGEEELVYAVPDRVRTVSTPAGSDVGEETIAIGFSTYTKQPDGRYIERTDGVVGPISAVMAVLDAVEDAHAESVGNGEYGVTIPTAADEGGPVTGEARISGGYLVGLSLSVERLGEPSLTTYEFSGFGVSGPVERPRPGQLMADPCLPDLDLGTPTSQCG